MSANRSMLEPAAAAAGGASPWWRRSVVYESHLPTLRDGNGDGVGDLLGLTESLDYLADLGIGAIWVGPFFRSPLLDQGFDVTDHTDIEPLFGDFRSFDRLLTEAHARGIRIIVDYIPNHTSDQHPWFLESRSSRENPKRDWYVWADAAPGRSTPTTGRARPAARCGSGTTRPGSSSCTRTSRSSRTSTGATPRCAKRCSTCCASGSTAGPTASASTWCTC